MLALIPFTIFAARQFETTYPSIPGVETPSEGFALPQYLEYIYYFAVGITGIIALAAFVSGGFVYLTSAGSPGRMRQGRARIIAGLSGVAIILGAHLALNTIDPQFFKDPTDPGLPSQGYCLRGREVSWKEGETCPEGWEKLEEENCQEALGESTTGAQQIQCCQIEPRTYCFDQNASEILPVGFIAEEVSFREKFPGMAAAFVFPEEGYKGDYIIILNTNPFEDETDEHWQSLTETALLGGSSSSGETIEYPQSIYIWRYQSGFYLFPAPGEDYSCGDYDFSDNLRNLPLLIKSPYPDLGSYNGRTECIVLYSLEEGQGFFAGDEIPWAGVFFTQNNYQGGCALIFGEQPTSGTFELTPGFNPSYGGRIGGGVGTDPDNSIHSAHVFKRNLDNDTLEGKVTFYSGIDYGEGSPGHVLPSRVITASDIGEQNSVNNIWDKNLDYPDGKNEWDQEHILSIKIDGKFLVVLNSEEDFTGDCTIITQNTPTLFGSFVLRNYRHGARIKAIAIIPYL